MLFAWVLRHLVLFAICAVLLLGYVGVLDLGATTSSIVRDAQTYGAGDQPLEPGGAAERLLQREHRALMDAAEDTGALMHVQGYYGALKEATWRNRATRRAAIGVAYASDTTLVLVPSVVSERVLIGQDAADGARDVIGVEMAVAVELVGVDFLAADGARLAWHEAAGLQAARADGGAHLLGQLRRSCP